MSPNEQNYYYDAFISYRRLDGANIAGWLRRHLQDYVLPPKIAEGRKKLCIYLDTAFERANDDFGANNIEPELRKSRYLVVVATPGTLQRRADGTQNWVEREIEFFLSLSQGRNVLVLLAKGEFAAELPGGLAHRFPHITIVDMRAFFPLVDRFYLRGALREHLLTVLGTLHDIESPQMPELRMEDARRARARATWFAMIAMALFVLISGLAVTALIQRNNAQMEARRADQNAKEARNKGKIAEENAEEAKLQTKNALANEAKAKRQQNIAQENALAAQRNPRESRAREFVAYANESLNEDPERSILLAMQAVYSTTTFREPPIVAGEDALHRELSGTVRTAWRACT